MTEEVRLNDKARNAKNNARIRGIVRDPAFNPIKTMNVLENGIVIAAIDTTRSRKTLRKSIQQFCIEHKVPIKETDRRILEAIRLIREEGVSVYESSRRVCNDVSLVPRIRYALARNSPKEEETKEAT